MKDNCVRKLSNLLKEIVKIWVYFRFNFFLGKYYFKMIKKNRIIGKNLLFIIISCKYNLLKNFIQQIHKISIYKIFYWNTWHKPENIVCVLLLNNTNNASLKKIISQTDLLVKKKVWNFSQKTVFCKESTDYFNKNDKIHSFYKKRERERFFCCC